MDKEYRRGRTICFGSFELHLDSGELFKRGYKIKLQGQPFELLAALLEQPAEVVTREELKQRVWPSDTVVDFDRGLNRAIKKIRDVLGDSTEKPRFIETLHRRGYRFIGKLEQETASGAVISPPVENTPSVGVLPFVSAGGSAETEYFAEGVSESITNNLSKLSRLRVAPRTTMLRFKSQNITPQRIGREAKIRNLLTGSVVWKPDMVRVQAELVSTVDGRQLWGKHYTRSFCGIFDIEDELAREITESLQVRLTDEDSQHFSQRHTDNDEAYRLYLQGRYFWNRRVVQRALECFDQAVKIDPSYALAWAGLANAYTLYFAFQIASPARSVQKVEESAAAALQIDPSTAEAHACLGFVKSFYHWDWPAGEQHFRRAIQLNPNLGTAQAWFAHALSVRGRNDEAVEVLTRALESEPASPTVHIVAVQTFLQVGRYQDALELCLKAFDLDPNLAIVSWALGLVYLHSGNYAQAIASFRRALQIRIPASKIPATAVLGWLGYSYARGGFRQKAQGVLAKLQEESGKRYVPPCNLALVHFGLKDREQGWRLLEEAWQDHSFWLAFLAPLTLRLIEAECDPRSLHLLSRMNLG